MRPVAQTRRPPADFIGEAKARAKRKGIPYAKAASQLAKENPGLLAAYHEDVARQQERARQLQELRNENAALRRKKQ